MVLFEELVAASTEAAKHKRIPVTVPEWEAVLNGRQLFLQQMSTQDRDAWESDGLEKRGDSYEVKHQNLRARLVARCLVDEDGEKVFPNADSMKSVPSTLVVPLYDKAVKLNRVTRDDVEEIAKNS